MAITRDHQIEIGGLVLGAGTPYNLLTIDGFGVPPVRSADKALQRRHGMVAGDDFLDGRGIVIEVECLGNYPGEDLSAITATLQAALIPGQGEASIGLQLPTVAGGGLREIIGRPRQSANVVDDRAAKGVPTFVIEVFATDPRIYDPTVQSLSVGLPAGSGGLTFPLTFPLTFGSSSSNSIVCNNAGNFATPPVLRINGPITNPRIENLTVGKETALDLVIASGDYIEIDVADPTAVLLNGTASRYGNLDPASEFFDLVPGDNEIRLHASSVDPAASLSVSWRSAWLA